jgi:hypothetical protein
MIADLSCGPIASVLLGIFRNQTLQEFAHIHQLDANSCNVIGITKQRTEFVRCFAKLLWSIGPGEC